MRIVICTLFEGHYHFGVAALTNSLYKSGYKGCIYAGYRGSLPSWASTAKRNIEFDWHDSTVYEVAEGLRIYFLPLETDYHLTNYKPDFMLGLLEVLGKTLAGIIYLDPDIVISAPWSFYEEWIDCGVALCEDVNSPLERLHPKRVAWRHYYGGFGVDLCFKHSIYANGGFVGIKIDQVGFLKAWRQVQELMGESIGGLSVSALEGSKQLPSHSSGDFAPFGKTDQDALNAAVELYDTEYSFLGKEAMAFSRGLAVMRHALGQPKPWNWRPLKQMIQGRPPRSVDKDYWSVVNSPIVTYGKFQVSKMRLLIRLSAFLGRFYRKN